MQAALSTWARIVNSALEGSFRRISTVSGSLASTASTFLKMALPGLATTPQRLSEATTSAAPSILPLWNLTLLRSRITYRLPPSCTSALSASSGTGWYFASSANRPSKTLTTISRVITAVVACASSVGGSPIIAIRSTPPAFAAAGLAAGVCASPSETASRPASTSTATTADSRSTRTMSTPPVGLVRYRGPPRPESDRVSPMQRPLIVHGVTIVTGDEAGTLLSDGALAVVDGRIAALGHATDVLARHATAERIEMRGRVVFPGLANTHTHLPRVLARGIYEDLSPPHAPPFTGGLAPLPLPTLSPDEERVMATLGALEAIRSGTTLVLEEGAQLERYATALADTGLRLLLCERVWDRARASIGQPGPFEQDAGLAEQGLARIRDLHARWHGRDEGRISVGVAAWAPDLCSPELLGRIRKLQDELQAMATIHLSQVWGEVAAIREQRGVTPIDYVA